jgi:hypothetical protein
MKKFCSTCLPGPMIEFSRESAKPLLRDALIVSNSEILRGLMTLETLQNRRFRCGKHVRFVCLCCLLVFRCLFHT